MGKRLYVIYDERAMADVDEAMVLVAGAETLEEARKDAEDFRPCVIYSYAEGKVGKNGATKIVDERFEEYIPA